MKRKSQRIYEETRSSINPSTQVADTNEYVDVKNYEPKVAGISESKSEDIYEPYAEFIFEPDESHLYEPTDEIGYDEYFEHDWLRFLYEDALLLSESIDENKVAINCYKNAQNTIKKIENLLIETVDKDSIRNLKYMIYWGKDRLKSEIINLQGFYESQMMECHLNNIRIMKSQGIYMTELAQRVYEIIGKEQLKNLLMEGKTLMESQEIAEHIHSNLNKYVNPEELKLLIHNTIGIDYTQDMWNNGLNLCIELAAAEIEQALRMTVRSEYFIGDNLYPKLNEPKLLMKLEFLKEHLGL